jgi:hypothetical protein
MPVTVAERRYILDTISGMAATDINNLWYAAEQQNEVDFAAFVIAAFPYVIDPYHQLAAMTSATLFELDHPREVSTAAKVANAQRESVIREATQILKEAAGEVAVSVPADIPTAPPKTKASATVKLLDAVQTAPTGPTLLAEPLPIEQLTKSAEWALGANGTDAIGRMSGTAQRAVYGADRETTVINAEASGMRWVRVAQFDACAFCRMLASRAASDDFSDSYESAKSALTVVGRKSNGEPRGKGRIGGLYHDHCRCVAVAFPETRNPIPYLREIEPSYAEMALQFDSEYRDARKKATSGDPYKILAAWRELNEGVA